MAFFVCLNTGRQENKNSRSLWKTHKQDISVHFSVESLLRTAKFKLPSYCSILHGKATNVTTFTRWILPVPLGSLIFSVIVFFFCFFLNVAALLHCPLGSEPICGSIVLLPVADISTRAKLLVHFPKLTHRFTAHVCLFQTRTRFPHL